VSEMTPVTQAEATPSALASIRAGLGALENRLLDGEDDVPAGDRVVMVTLLLSLRDALREVEQTGVGEPGLAELRRRVEAMGERLELFPPRRMPLRSGGRLLQRLPQRRPREIAVAGTPVEARGQEPAVAAPEPPAPPPPAPAPAPVAPVATEPAAPAVPRPSAGRVALRAGRWLTAAGLLAAVFVGYELAGTGLDHDRSQAALLTAFKAQLPTTSLDAPTAAIAEGSPVALVDIPGIGVHQVVVEGTSPDDLAAGPGHLRSSPLPGEYGISVLAGRRMTYGGPFRSLDALHRGDTITTTTGQGSFTYTVSDVRHVSAGDPGATASDGKSRLELVTSDPLLLATGRLMVTATLQGDPVAVAARPPATVGGTDLGLDGEATGFALALFWALLVAATLWAVRHMHPRWPRAVTYTFAAPVLLTLAVLVFSSLDRVLPGTL
jgi:sortase A